MLPRRGPSFFFMALQAFAPGTLHNAWAARGERGQVGLGLACVKGRQGNTHLAACLMASRVPVELRLITFSYSSSCRQIQAS